MARAGVLFVLGLPAGISGGVGFTLRPIATRAKNTAISTQMSDGTNTQGKFRIRHKVVGNVSGGVTLAFPNRSNESDGDAAITVSARLEYPAGSGIWVDLEFGGETDVVIPVDGADAWSDPVNIPMVDGEYLRTETYVRVATGGDRWPLLDSFGLLGTNGEGRLLSTSDISGQSPTNGNVAGPYNVYGPVAILGRSDAPRACAIVGDSIPSGATASYTADSIGWAAKALDAHIPSLSVASSGESAAEWNAAHDHRLALLNAAGVTDAIVHMGGNDINAGDSAAVVQTALMGVYADLIGLGLRVSGAPISTRTTSASGNWTSAADQTITTGFTIAGRADTVNTWMSGLPAGLGKFVDIRPGIQVANKFLTDGTDDRYTGDGVHYSEFGHLSVVALFPDLDDLLPAA